MTEEELTRARTQIKSRVTRFKNMLDKIDGDSNFRVLEYQISDYKPLLEKFNDVQLKLEILTKREEDLIGREEFETKFYDTLAEAEQLLDNIKKNNLDREKSDYNQSKNPSSNIPVQLPVINLPKFSGLYTEWTAFYDSFNSIIHQNKSLSDVQKFHYLKGCLLADAKRTIESLPVTAESYCEAFQLLKDRYENKRLIVQHHLHAIFNLNSVDKSSSSLRELLDVFNSNFAALKTQLKAENVETESWDVLLVYLLSTKFDFITKREWEADLKSTELPTLKQIITFIEHRCLTYELMQVDQTRSQKNLALKPKSQEFSGYKRNINNYIVGHLYSVCVLCKRNHFIHKCTDF